MKKVLISLVLCVMLIMQVMCVFGYEYTPYVGDGVVASTSVAVKYEKKVTDGYEAVSEIEDATRIVASCKVKPGSEYDGTEVKVSLVAVGYKGMFLRDFEISYVTFTSVKDGSKTLTTTLDIENTDIDGIKVYLWDSVENAKPLLNKGVPGSGNNDVDGIIIGGEVVEFDAGNTASAEVNAGYVEWPDIIVLASDISADATVDLEGAFPLSQPVHTLLESNVGVMGTSKTGVVTAKVGDETYTVYVTQKTPQITDVKFRKFSDIAGKSTAETYYTDAQVKIQYDVQNPKWTAELPGPNAEDTSKRAGDYYDGVETLEGVTFAYSDTRGASAKQNGMILCNIHPELIGSQFISTPWTSSSNTNTSVKEAYKFTVDRSCRVYYQCRGTKILDSSWTRMYNYMHSTEGSLSQRIYYEMRCSETSNSLQIGTGHSVFYKDYDVKPGETCEIVLPVDTHAPKIFVKYKNNDFVTNATYTTDLTKTISKTALVAHPYYKNPDLTIEEGLLNTLVGADYSVAKFYADKGNLLFGTNVFDGDTYSQYCVIDLPDEVVGATALVMPMTMTDVKKIEFDIDSSARVYVFTNIQSKLEDFKAALGDTWTNTAFEYADVTLTDNDAAITTRASGKVNYLYNSSSFYKDFVVQPDEGGHITIPFYDGVGGSTRIIVMVKPLEK